MIIIKDYKRSSKPEDETKNAGVVSFTTTKFPSSTLHETAKNDPKTCESTTNTPDGARRNNVSNMKRKI